MNQVLTPNPSAVTPSPGAGRMAARLAEERSARALQGVQATVLAQAATGRWLQPLADALAADRAAYAGKPRAKPAWLRYADLEFSSDLNTAFTVLHVVLRGEVQRPRQDDEGAPWKAPVLAVVARNIGAALDAPEDKRFAVGQRLLQHAAAVGLIDPLTPERRDGTGRHQAVRVRLSPAASADVRGLTAALLAQTDVPGFQPFATEPAAWTPVTADRIMRNPRGKLAPPLPEGTAVADALQVIDSTGWRVNQYMLETLTDLGVLEAQRGERPPTNAEQAALMQAAVAPPVFYFRARFDFRGRVYSSGGLALQYTGGSDYIRSLLEFADGAPLTERGRHWLYLHVSNCWGKDGIARLSDDQRAAYVALQREKFIGYAVDPIGTRDEWGQAKAPYRFLAACEALRRDREGLPVHLPCAVDATSSGLQLYAWLMRDTELGHRVNLLPGDYQDFYAAVASEVDQECDRDLAKKIVVPLMYGGGQPDARKRVVAAGFSTDEARGIVAGVYRVTGELAPGAKRLREALRKVARSLTDRGDTVGWRYQAPKAGESEPRRTPAAYAGSVPIVWQTPSGFRCVLDSRIQQKTRLRYRVGSREYAATVSEPTDTIDAKKQRQGMAPDVIHSLDAALLVASVNRGAVQGVRDWALAHDSYAVHPNHGDMRQAVLRDAAKEMFAADVLADLWQQFARQGPVGQMPEHPAELPPGFGDGVHMYR